MKGGGRFRIQAGFRPAGGRAGRRPGPAVPGGVRVAEM